MPAIDDPAELVRYLEDFLAAVVMGVAGAPYALWTDHIRGDLMTVFANADEPTRQKSMELFKHIESGRYVLERNPEMRRSVVVPAIQDLINHLKQAAGVDHL